MHDYPDKRVRLDVWRVLDIAASSRRAKASSCDWVEVDALEGLPLLAADLPIIAALRERGASVAGA